MRATILLAQGICCLLAVAKRILTKILKQEKKDLAIFLHSPLNSDGHNRRFKVFYQFFNRDKISYAEFGYLDEKTIHKHYDNPRYKQYLTYAHIVWIRAFQIPKAIEYKTVILQRNLFPIYPDYKTPVFEKILRKQNKHIILDIWDPVHLWNPTLTYATFKYVDKLTVNTSRFEDVFKKYFPAESIFVWPIAVDFNKYAINKGEKSDVIKLFYTGSESNTKQYLNPLIPIIENLAKTYKLELTVMGKYAPKSENIEITHHTWNDALFSKLISEATIGLYPNFNINKNKKFAVAGKVLDYMGSCLPMIGADQGLPDGVIASNIMIVANAIEDWEIKLPIAIEEYSDLREKAQCGYTFVQKNLNLEKSYENLLKIIQS